MAPIARADVLLGRLADALGCPIATFFPEAESDPAAFPALELVRLWDAIEEPQSRQRILAVARQEAQRQRDARSCGAADQPVQPAS